MVQWLRLHASITRGSGSIPGQGTKMPHGVAKKKRKKSMGIKHWCLSLIPQRFLFSYSGVLPEHQAFRTSLGDFNMQQSMGRREGLIFTPNSTLCCSCCLFPFSSSLQTTSPLMAHVTDDHLLELLDLFSPLSELQNEPREGSAYSYNPVLWFCLPTQSTARER